MRATTSAHRRGEQELIKGELNHLLAMVKKDLAWAEVQDSYGHFDAFIGTDPVPGNMDALSVAGLAEAFVTNMHDWTGN